LTSDGRRGNSEPEPLARRASHAALFGERGEDDEEIQVDPP
jgi:hypothetical protein